MGLCRVCGHDLGGGRRRPLPGHPRPQGEQQREFLLGGRQMTALPVAMSLTASFMSGITVIGTPAESYRFGSAFWLFGFSYAIMSVVTAELFVPLFYRLGITSTYEVRQHRHRNHSNGPKAGRQNNFQIIYNTIMQACSFGKAIQTQHRLQMNLLLFTVIKGSWGRTGSNCYKSIFYISVK